MSRLDSAIRRLEAQRACLDRAMAAVADKPGVVYELGLGNGRTYDHLRQGLPRHEIFVFDRQVAAHPDCIPDAEHLRLGDFRETLRAAAAQHHKNVILLHADIGSGRPDVDAELAAALAPLLPALLASGAWLVTDQRLPLADARKEPLPESVSEGRYSLLSWPNT